MIVKQVMYSLKFFILMVIFSFNSVLCSNPGNEDEALDLKSKIIQGRCLNSSYLSEFTYKDIRWLAANNSDIDIFVTLFKVFGKCLYSSDFSDFIDANTTDEYFPEAFVQMLSLTETNEELRNDKEILLLQNLVGSIFRDRYYKSIRFKPAPDDADLVRMSDEEAKNHILKILLHDGLKFSDGLLDLIPFKNQGIGNGTLQKVMGFVYQCTGFSILEPISNTIDAKESERRSKINITLVEEELSSAKPASFNFKFKPSTRRNPLVNGNLKSAEIVPTKPDGASNSNKKDVSNSNTKDVSGVSNPKTKDVSGVSNPNTKPDFSGVSNSNTNPNVSDPEKGKNYTFTFYILFPIILFGTFLLSVAIVYFVYYGDSRWKAESGSQVENSNNYVIV